MGTGTVSALDYGIQQGAGRGEYNTAAFQRAVDEIESTGGGTIFVPSGVYEITGAIRLRTNADPECSTTVRIVGEEHPTIAQTAGGAHFEIKEPTKDGGASDIVVDGLTLQGALETPNNARPEGQA